MVQVRKHRIGDGTLIPCAGVAATVEVEGGRPPGGRSAAAGAGHVLAHAGGGGILRGVSGLGHPGIHAVLPRRVVDIGIAQRGPELHELLVDLPELARLVRDPLNDVGRAEGVGLALDRQMPEDISHPLAEAVPQVLDHRVHRPGAKVRVAAVLDKCHLRIGRPEYVIAARVNR